MVNEEISKIEEYIQRRQGESLVLPNYAKEAGDSSGTVMVCLVESSTPSISPVTGQDLQAIFRPSANHILGLPVVSKNVFSVTCGHSRFNFSHIDSETKLKVTDHGYQRLTISSLDNFAFVRDERGNTTGVEAEISISDLLASKSSSHEDIVLRNDSSQTEGWTSLHIRRVSSTAKMRSFVLNHIPEKEVRQFVQKTDDAGWSAMHWSAYIDDVETVESDMASLSFDEQVEMANTPTDDQRGWTVLHVAAVKDSMKTMVTLKNKFPENIQWQMLKSRSTNHGMTPLHLAVAKGNARAVIMLLDVAADRSDELLDCTDNDGLTPRDYTSETSLTGRVLRAGPQFLHHAAETDDRALVDHVLTNLCDASAAEVINRQNAVGLTVLQVAAKCSSSQVIELLTQRLTYDELIDSLREYSGDGETALHIAARFSSPTALHQLLSNIDRRNRENFINCKNMQGESLLEVNLDCQLIQDTLICKHLKNLNSRKFMVEVFVNQQNNC